MAAQKQIEGATLLVRRGGAEGQVEGRAHGMWPGAAFVSEKMLPICKLTHDLRHGQLWSGRHLSGAASG